jgi:branched-chain amino acid transport system ATP-binding protein
MTAMLNIKDLRAYYGQVQALHGLEFGLNEGSLTTLLGANGAGKTTTLLTLAGELAPLAGEVRLRGRPTTAPMHARCRDGLGFLTEGRSVIMGLTARENLRLADVDPDVAVDLFPELGPLLPRSAGLLSGGEQQMLSLARALGRAPDVLLADELSLGLAPMVVERLLASVRQAADERGVAVLLVEQHVRHALSVADRVYVMERGRVSLSGAVADVRAKIEDIEVAYLSAAAPAAERKDTASHG